MKVYVIKRNDGSYYKRYFDNYIQFDNEIRFAEMFSKKLGAEETMDFITRNKYKFNILPEELSVVECSLMEVTELADYTKQVRQETLKELDYAVLRRMAERPNTLTYKDALCEYFLNQIQGETK